MKPLSSEVLILSLDRLCQKVGGNWLLVGGSLVRLELDPNRGTHDIDLVPIPLNDDPKLKQKLFETMKELGLSPEQVNSAASFFVGEATDWESEIVLLKRFSNGKIFRPTLTLFAYLKLRRGSEIDLSDLNLATQKWGRDEFNSKKFCEWSSDALQAKAKVLGLL